MTTESFDYGDLLPSDVEELEQRAAAIRKTARDAQKIEALAVIEIGRELAAVHERLSGTGRDGMFGPWVKAECGYTSRSAYRFMAACKVFGKCDTVSHLFERSALYLLSADSCPPKARHEALRRAKKGNAISKALATKLRKEHTVEATSKPAGQNGKAKVGTKSKPSDLLSQRALAAKTDVANGVARAAVLVAHCFVNNSEYKYAAQVAASGNRRVIDAMDDGLLGPRPAVNILSATPKEIEARIEKAEVAAAQKKHHALSSKGKTKSERLLDMLERTWVDWKGFAHGVPINSKLVPKDPERRKDFDRLSRNVREAVNTLLDAIDKEAGKCSKKTAEQKTC